MIFLTYQTGFYAIYLLMRSRVEDHWQNKALDPDLTGFIMLSTPLSLPYWPDQKTFQPSSGLVRINDQFLRLIKYRYATDTLYLLLMPDEKMELLHAALRDWAISFTSIPVSKKGNVEWWKSMCRDFLQSVLSFKKKKFSEQKILYGQIIQFTYLIFLEVPSPPPKRN